MNDSSEGENKKQYNYIYILTHGLICDGNICKIFKQNMQQSEDVSRKDMSKFRRI